MKKHFSANSYPKKVNITTLMPIKQNFKSKRTLNENEIEKL